MVLTPLCSQAFAPSDLLQPLVPPDLCPCLVCPGLHSPAMPSLLAPPKNRPFLPWPHKASVPFSQPMAPLAPDPMCLQASDDEMLVCTVGELRVWPGASNVIPGSVQFSVDIRAKVRLRQRGGGEEGGVGA